MKKIALITIYGETNFGNKLQNYAAQQFIRSLGFECETLVFFQPEYKLGRVKNIIKIVLGEAGIKKYEMSRELNFRRFSNRYISRRIIDDLYSKEALSKEYDYFAVGSDQVWNPCFGGYEKLYDAMFLTFVPPNKKLCIAPSFGVSKIPSEWEESFRIGINSFPKINVRETDGCRIVHELTGKEAMVMPDPTMLIKREEWDRIAGKNTKKIYGMLYYLGNEIDLEAYGIDRTIPILNINSRTDGSYYRYGPSDFVRLIRDAQFVVTDSFHACVFSILYGRPFLLVDRRDSYDSMRSRFETLFDLFGIVYDYLNPKFVKVDEEKAQSILDKKRKDASEYFSSCLR